MVKYSFPIVDFFFALSYIIVDNNNLTSSYARFTLS